MVIKSINSMMQKTLFLIICFFVWSPFAYNQTWNQLTTIDPKPTARCGHTAVYDNNNHKMIVFGGNLWGPGMTNDVWVLSNDTMYPTWAQLTVTGDIPVGRWTHSAVYDDVNNRMIIFGGYDSYNYYNDVYVLTNANGLTGTPTWIKLTPTGAAPSKRVGHNAVYDSTNNRMIIFGGNINEITYFNDVWILSNANGLGGTPSWSQLSTDNGIPDKRYAHSGCYDSINNKMIIFGGRYGNDSYKNDTWILSNANGLNGIGYWSQISTIGNIPATRWYHNTVYDPTTNRMILFGGGYLVGTIFYNDNWILTNPNGLGGNTSWIQTNPNGVLPTSRAFSSSVFDSDKNCLVVFGGFYNDGTEHVLNDVWILDNANPVSSWYLY